MGTTTAIVPCMTTTNTLRILDAETAEILGHIERDASDAEFSALRKSLGGACIDWDPNFYEGAVESEDGRLLAILSPYNAT